MLNGEDAANGLQGWWWLMGSILSHAGSWSNDAYAIIVYVDGGRWIRMEKTDTMEWMGRITGLERFFFLGFFWKIRSISTLKCLYIIT